MKLRDMGNNQMTCFWCDFITLLVEYEGREIGTGNGAGRADGGDESS